MTVIINIDYTNHRGIREIRQIIPVRIWHGTSQYHNGEQWFLEAIAVDRNHTKREYAMKSIHRWGVE